MRNVKIRRYYLNIVTLIYLLIVNISCDNKPKNNKANLSQTTQNYIDNQNGYQVMKHESGNKLSSIEKNNNKNLKKADSGNAVNEQSIPTEDEIIFISVFLPYLHFIAQNYYNIPTKKMESIINTARIIGFVPIPIGPIPIMPVPKINTKTIKSHRVARPVFFFNLIRLRIYLMHKYNIEKIEIKKEEETLIITTNIKTFTINYETIKEKLSDPEFGRNIYHTDPKAAIFTKKINSTLIKEKKIQPCDYRLSHYYKLFLSHYPKCNIKGREFEMSWAHFNYNFLPYSYVYMKNKQAKLRKLIAKVEAGKSADINCDCEFDNKEVVI